MVVYDHECLDNFGEVYQFRPLEFIEKAKHLKSGLKELIVYRREQLHQGFIDVEMMSLSPLGSLRDFTALVHLSITAHLLLGYQICEGSGWSDIYREQLPDETHKVMEVLPSSLQKLRLMNCGTGIIQDTSTLR